MNMRSVKAPTIQTAKHACAGTLWTFELDQRGIGRAAFCESRAQGGTATLTALPSTIQHRLNEQLGGWRQRRFPRWVWVNPRADAFVEGARDLGACTEAVVSSLAARRIGSLIHTRGGVPAGERLVMMGRRSPGLLRVDLEFFSARFEKRRTWERGTPSNEARLELIDQLLRNGVEVGVRLGPLIPGVNDEHEDWAPLLEALANRGITKVAPIWFQPSRRLITQIRREISSEAVRRIEAVMLSGDDTRYVQWQIATMNMIRRRSLSLGLEVARCSCGPERSGTTGCLEGPREGRESKQLALFG